MSYPGSKAGNGVWQRIIGQMPPHSVYVEPFFGSGHVFRMKRRSEYSVIMDLDPDCFADFLGDKEDLAVKVICGDSLRWLKQIDYCLGQPAVVYCDPPYLLSTRKGRRYYRHEMTDEQHRELLKILCGLKCHVLISHPPCDLYLEALQNWRCIRYKTRWHTKTALDALWCNFPEPTELHDWRYCGVNHRQRTALKRLAGRFVARFNRMPPRKRGYVLHHLKEHLYGTGTDKQTVS